MGVFADLAGAVREHLSDLSSGRGSTTSSSGRGRRSCSARGLTGRVSGWLLDIPGAPPTTEARFLRLVRLARVQQERDLRTV